MPPQIRPSSSLPQELDARPSSSASIRRPLSSASSRPPSAASVQRPGSRTSVRPTSRVSARPGSRHSARPRSRQSSRLQYLFKSLVTHVTSLQEDTHADDFHVAVELVSKGLEYNAKGAPGLAMSDVDRRIDGLAQKAQIQNNDTLAEALRAAYSKLKTHADSQTQDLDADIKMSKFPDHMQLLLALSMSPAPSTLSYASSYLHNLSHPASAPATLTWQTIYAEEPLEGQHWQGAYGLPSGSTREGWENESLSGEESSILSLSPLRDPRDWFLSDVNGELEADQPSNSSIKVIAGDNVLSGEPNQSNSNEWLRQIFVHRREVERLQERQYWRSDWRSTINSHCKFDIGDPSTLGPAVRRTLLEDLPSSFTGIKQESYIEEHDAYRDVLMALQNRDNTLIMRSRDEEDTCTFEPSPTAPRLSHFTLTSQQSLLASFARYATILFRLRTFSIGISQSTSEHQSGNFLGRSLGSRPAIGQRRVPRTVESFGEAIINELNSFDIWCAEREADVICAAAGSGPPLTVSLLSLKKAIEDAFGSTFDVLWAVVCQVFQAAKGRTHLQMALNPWNADEWLKIRVSPARVTSLVLNTLLEAVYDCCLRGEGYPAAAVFRVFTSSVNPVWDMTRKWLRDGMNTRLNGYSVVGIGAVAGGSLDEEFFIEDNELPILDPDFWAEGFVLREFTASEEGSATLLRSPRAVPTFLAHVAELILGAGRALGLLRALETGSEALSHEYLSWVNEWKPFASVMQSMHDAITKYGAEISGAALSQDVLSNIVYDTIAPHCQVAQAILAKVLIEDCEFNFHLQAIEDLYLMRRGDAMAHFTDALFARMDSSKPWTDFHFLNTSFRDVVETGSSPKSLWITPALVRFSFRKSTRVNDRTVHRTVNGIDGLNLEYAAPFPLTYIFGPHALGIYGSIFVFLLQIRRAKNVLERILLRDIETLRSKAEDDLKILYAMRGKLSWFVNTVLNFLATNVLQTGLSAFHRALKDAQSLDVIIKSHNEHLNKIHRQCFLEQNTAAIHRAIIAILDMCIYFSNCFVAFAGDTTLDITHQSITVTQRHRSRRLRRQQRNIVGFSQVVSEVLLDDSDSDSDLDEKSHQEPSFSAAGADVSLADEGLSSRLDKMALELDGLVRFVRKGAESLASDGLDASATFDVLAFALEDWDR